MPQTELETARTLIQQKRFAEARELLKTVDHPIATKWLAKLDTIDSSPEETESQSPTRDKRTSPRWLMWVNGFVLVFLVFMVLSLQLQLSKLSRTIGTVEMDVTELIDVVNSHASDINAIAAVANNADRHAHSHGYSDMALKKDIDEITNPLERILSLRGVSFAWNNEAFPDLQLKTGRDYGIVAQELADVFPELVTPDAETGFLRVDYQGLIPVLVEAIQEQQLEIDELRAEIRE